MYVIVKGSPLFRLWTLSYLLVIFLDIPFFLSPFIVILIELYSRVKIFGDIGNDLLLDFEDPLQRVEFPLFPLLSLHLSFCHITVSNGTSLVQRWTRKLPGARNPEHSSDKNLSPYCLLQGPVATVYPQCTYFRSLQPTVVFITLHNYQLSGLHILQQYLHPSILKGLLCGIVLLKVQHMGKKKRHVINVIRISHVCVGFMSRDFFLIESIEREPNYILGHVLVFSQ